MEDITVENTGRIPQTGTLCLSVRPFNPEGVSLVVSQRNEVGSVVERNGMSGLIETMRERSTEGSTVL